MTRRILLSVASVLVVTAAFADISIRTPILLPKDGGAPKSDAGSDAAQLDASAPIPTSGPPDLKCEILAFGNSNSPVANNGFAKPILETNGMHSFEYLVVVTNAGGATGSSSMTKYDYVQVIGGQTFTNTKPLAPYAALPAGAVIQVGKMKLSASGPFPNKHTITVTLDATNQITESNESNNTCTITVNLN